MLDDNVGLCFKCQNSFLINRGDNFHLVNNTNWYCNKCYFEYLKKRGVINE